MRRESFRIETPRVRPLVFYGRLPGNVGLSRAEAHYHWRATVSRSCSGREGNAALKKHGLTPSAVSTVARNSLEVQAAVDSIGKTTPQAVVMAHIDWRTGEAACPGILAP